MHLSGARSKQSTTSREYPDMTSNVKCLDANIKTERTLMNLSVQYKGQQKILSQPNGGNSMWDRGPQHTMKQQQAEAPCTSTAEQKCTGKPDTAC